MRFESARLIALLAVVALAAWGAVVAERRRQRDLNALVRPSLQNDMIVGQARRLARVVLPLAALILLALAIAGPRRASLSETPRMDRDIFVVVDTSLSMAAEDVKPSRIQYARTLIRGLLQRLQGERIGIIAFAGRAIVQCPLTRDYSAALMLADSLGPNILPQPGTALIDALRQSLRAFERDRGRTRILVLVTDGEDHGPSAQAMAARLRKSGVHVFVVGVGSETGAPIPLRDDRGTLTGYKRDRAGRLVTTRMYPEMLRSLAEEAGGRFYEITPESGQLNPLLDTITRVAGVHGARRLRKVASVFAAVALLLLLIDPYVAVMRRPVWPFARLARNARYLPK